MEYVTQQIANHVMAEVNKKNKNANLKAHVVRNHLWVFVNALIENPAFDQRPPDLEASAPSASSQKLSSLKVSLMSASIN